MFYSTSWCQFSTNWCHFFNLLMPLFQPPNATFSIFQECQSCESEVLVWVSPNHSSSTRDLEKPILALPLHRIGPLPYPYRQVGPYPLMRAFKWCTKWAFTSRDIRTAREVEIWNFLNKWELNWTFGLMPYKAKAHTVPHLKVNFPLLCT